MEIYLKHPLVVWCIFAPIALAILVVIAVFLVVSFLPSPSVEELVARYTRKGRK
jgi:hypothetical protein